MNFKHVLKTHAFWFALVAVTSSAAPIYAIVRAGSAGYEWTGAQYMSPGDLTVYLSYIGQAAHGSWRISNEFTTEGGEPTLNIIWLAVGLLARFLDLSPSVAFQVARVALIAPFCATLRWSLKQFLGDTKERDVATVLLIFGSGFGGIIRRLVCQDATCGASMGMPPDIWVGEFNPLMSATFSPHFVASWTLLIVTITQSMLAMRDRTLRWAFLAGATSLALFQFHPYYVPLVWALAGVFCLYSNSIKPDRKTLIRQLVIIVGLSSPSFLYHSWISLTATNKEWIFGATLTPAPYLVIVSLGLFLNASLRGWRVLRSRSALDHDQARYLLVWLVVHSLFLYAPVSFNRRFMEGLIFPFAVLAAVGVTALLREVHGLKRWLTVCLLAAAFFGTTADSVLRQFELFSDVKNELYFHSQEDAAAYRWISQNTPRSAVFLSTFQSGNFIGGWGERRVYLGHWAQTLHKERKIQEVDVFLKTDSDDQQYAFLKARGITHVFVGPRELTVGARLRENKNLVRVYSTRSTSVFAVKE